MATGRAEQATLLTAGLDTADYEAGAARVEKTNTRLGASLGAVGNASEQTERRLQQSGRGFDSLVRKLDDAARGAYEFARAEATIQRGLDAGRTSRERANELLDLARQRYLNIKPAADGATDSVKLHGYQWQNLTAQLTDFAVQVGSGGGLFRPLLQQTPQAVDAVGGVSRGFALIRQNAATLLGGGALALVAGGLAGITIAAERQERSINTLATGMQRVRGDYGEAAREINGAARALGESTSLGTQEAREALGTLARVPGLITTRDNLVELGKLSRDLGAAFGEDATRGAERLAEALTDPAAAARRYFEDGREGVRGFDAEFVRHIELLEAGGKKGQAGAEVAARLGKALADAGERATPLQTAWKNLTEAMTGAANAAGDRSNSLGQSISSGLASGIDALTRLLALYDRVNKLGEGRLGKLLFSPTLGLGEGDAGVQGGDLGGRSLFGTMFGSREGGSAGITGTERNARADAAVSYFTGQGWSREQAAGIVANLHAESGLEANRVGDGGRAYGVAQWHPDRQAAFQAYSGKSIRESTLEEQYAFVQHELTAGAERGAGDRLRGATTAGEAGDIVSRYYERPRATEAEASFRGRLAGAIYARSPAEEALPLPPAMPPPPETAARAYTVADPQGEADARLAAARERGLRGAERETLGLRLGTAEADLAATPQGTAAYRDRAEVVEQLRSQIERLKPVEDSYVETLKRQNAAGEELDPTMRAVTQRTQEFDEAMRREGKTGQEPEVLEARKRVVEETLRGITLAYKAETDQTERSIASQGRIAAAWTGGAQAAQHQANAERALEEVRRSGIQGDAARRAEVERLTEQYDRLTASLGRARVAQAEVQQRNTLEQISTASGLVGRPEGEVASELSALRARQFLSNTPGAPSAESAAGQDFIKLSRNISDASMQLYRQQDAWRGWQQTASSAIDRMGEATLEAIGSGKWSDWRQAGLRAIKDITNELLRLAVLNPIKNATLGTNYGTAADLTKGIGGWFRGGSTGGGGYTADGLPTSSTLSGLSAVADANVAGGAAGIHGGGMAGDESTYSFVREMPLSVFREAPRYHSGGLAGAGRFLPDEVPAVLRRREMILTEGQQAAVRRNLSAERANVPQRPVVIAPTINISTPNPGGFRQSQAQMGSDVARMLAASARRI